MRQQLRGGMSVDQVGNTPWRVRDRFVGQEEGTDYLVMVVGLVLLKNRRHRGGDIPCGEDTLPLPTVGFKDYMPCFRGHHGRRFILRETVMFDQHVDHIGQGDVSCGV